MCGIVGKVSSTALVDPGLLARMRQTLEHRGPDSEGMHVEDGVGLGIRRLAIIDLDTGDQPIYNEDRTVVVVLNGEIYNYVELRAELERAGHRFSTGSDTEVIVHLYEDLGDDCVRRLRGMFAFALWDARERRLLLARDRVGKKPLFYVDGGDTIWFASETKAMLQDPAIDRRPNLQAIDSFLHYQYVPHPLAAFDGMAKLPPAHVLTWRAGRTDVRRYWRLSYSPDLTDDEPTLRERLRAELLDATALRLRSDVPVGIFLSGGLDSSAVVAAAAARSSKPIRTFSIGISHDQYDETQYAREVATLFDTEHHEFRVEPHAVEILPRLAWHYGEPFADHSAIPTFFLSELTRRHVTVALNGDGGDEDFAGYAHYFSNRLAERLDRPLLPILPTARALSERLGTGAYRRSARNRLWRLCRTAGLTPSQRFATWIAFFTEAERDDLYTPEFRAAVGERWAPTAIEAPYATSDARDLVDRLLDVDVNAYLPGCLLVKMDIASMASSLEVRSPLLDQRFMEFAARLPVRHKLGVRDTKRIFKDAMRPWLPDRIVDRPKRGFGLPLADWFRGELRRLPGEVLLDPAALGRGYFRESSLRGLIDRHLAGSEDNANKLWALVQLELWLRLHIDRPPPLEAPASLSLSGATKAALRDV